MDTTISIQEALIYTMVTTSAADSNMTDAELKMIGELVKTLPVFETFNLDKLVHIASQCSELLQYNDGLTRILSIISSNLPEKLYDTAYALAVEVASADRHLEQEELRFLQMLRDHFSLDRLTVAAIERSANARFRRA